MVSSPTTMKDFASAMAWWSDADGCGGGDGRGLVMMERSKNGRMTGRPRRFFGRCSEPRAMG